MPATDSGTAWAGAGAGLGHDRDALARKHARYRELIADIRAVVQRVVPAGSAVAVVSKGDDELLNLEGRRGWHFPQAADGGYVGHHPGTSADAIAQLEAVRAKGADYLLFPATSFWWLDHYVDFRLYLHEHYRLVHEDEVCRIYALRLSQAPKESSSVSAHDARYRELVGQVQEVVDAILPADATVLVLSGGDRRLLELGGRRAWHFPQGEEGAYRRQPADRPVLDAQLDRLRQAGARFLVVPQTMFEWLESAQLKPLLEERFRLLVRQQHVCLIFEQADARHDPSCRAVGRPPLCTRGVRGRSTADG